MRGGYSGSWVLAAVVSACLSQQVLAGDTAPGASSERKAQAADAVARSAQYAGEAADETADCGGLSYLLAALPDAGEQLGMTEVYRGCESPVTVNLLYAGEAGQLAYTLGILDAGLAELPEGREYWQSILDVNRESMQSLMSAQGKLAASGQGHSKTVSLGGDVSGVMFREGKSWSLVAVPHNRYALRIDLDGISNARAHAMLMDAAAALDMTVLDK